MLYLNASIFSVLLDIAVVVSYPNIQLTTVLGQLNEPTDAEESNDMPPETITKKARRSKGKQR